MVRYQIGFPDNVSCAWSPANTGTGVLVTGPAGSFVFGEAKAVFADMQDARDYCAWMNAKLDARQHAAAMEQESRRR